MANAAWLQEPIKDSYAKELLQERYKEDYSYFLVLTMESTVVSGINKKDENDKFEIVLEQDKPLRDSNFTYDDKREFLLAGGSLEEYARLERRGKIINYIIVPLLLIAVAAAFAFLQLNT